MYNILYIFIETIQVMKIDQDSSVIKRTQQRIRV